MRAVLEHVFTIQTGISACLGYVVGYFMGWRAGREDPRPNRSSQ